MDPRDFATLKSVGSLYGNPAVEKDNFMSPLVSVSDNARTLVEALRQLSNRLCGVEHAETAEGPYGAIGDGIFGEVHSRATHINEMVVEANRLIRRIENLLP